VEAERVVVVGHAEREIEVAELEALVGVADRAQAAVADLRKGVKLDDAFMQKYGLRDSGRLMQGGRPDLGDIFDFAAEAKLSPKIYAATKKLEAGQVSDPIDDSDGLHIVVMNARKQSKALDYDAVRSRVWTERHVSGGHSTKDCEYGRSAEDAYWYRREGPPAK